MRLSARVFVISAAFYACSIALWRIVFSSSRLCFKEVRRDRAVSSAKNTASLTLQRVYFDAVALKQCVIRLWLRGVVICDSPEALIFSAFNLKKGTPLRGPSCRKSCSEITGVSLHTTVLVHPYPGLR
jgi:hypothetical protein